MIAINHALAGANIGLLIGRPELAIPAAVLSHFICDVIPHYHSGQTDAVLHKTRMFPLYLLSDAGLCFLLVVLLFTVQPTHWLLAAVCAFAAAAPDFLWINEYLTHRRGQAWHPGRFSTFAKNIQWFQRPIGVVVEAAWFIAACSLLVPWLR